MAFQILSSITFLGGAIVTTPGLYPNLNTLTYTV